METYWIWSNEHGAWWGPDYRGYVRTLDAAGVYTLDQTTRIITGANINQGAVSWLKRNEVAIPRLRDVVA